MMGYFGFLRIGEMTQGASPHTIKFSDAHFERERRMVVVVLQTSKTHTTASKPQVVCINCLMKDNGLQNKITHGASEKYCPCEIILNYVLEQGKNAKMMKCFSFQRWNSSQARAF